MSYTSEKAEGFTAMIESFGTTLEHNGVSYECLAPPEEQILRMSEGPMVASRPAEFSLVRANFNASGIGNKSIVRHREKAFQVYSIIDDDQEPFVDLRCQLKQ